MRVLPLLFLAKKTVVAGIEELRREAGVSLRESSVRPQFEDLVSASDALKKALASAKINPPAAAAVQVSILQA